MSFDINEKLCIVFGTTKKSMSVAILLENEINKHIFLKIYN